MSIKFRCNECDHIIVNKYMRPGEIIPCPNCGAKNVIEKITEDVVRHKIKKVRSPEEKIDRTLSWMIYGIAGILNSIFYLPVVSIVVNASVIVNSAILIFVIFTLVTLFRLKKHIRNQTIIYFIYILTVVAGIVTILNLFNIGSIIGYYILYLLAVFYAYLLVALTNEFDILKDEKNGITYLLLIVIGTIIYNVIPLFGTSIAYLVFTKVKTSGSTTFAVTISMLLAFVLLIFTNALSSSIDSKIKQKYNN